MLSRLKTTQRDCQLNLSYYWAANNGAGGETLEFHHPDRLGTRLVTNNAANTSFEQSTLPFGTAMPSESTGFSNQVFTSYDRSPIAGLDYAVNRTYSPGQGRFTQVDPIGLASANLADPQTNNLYAYTRNSPTDFVDPSGLCVIGINILGTKRVSNDTLDAIRQEIQRIFSAAGQTVSFDNSVKADARFTISLTNAPSTADSRVLGSTGVNKNGVISSSGVAYVDRIADFSGEPNQGLRILGRHPKNQGRAIGRVISHEAGHFLLQLLGHVKSGLLREQFRGDRSLFLPSTADDFLFTDEQARQLSRLCPPKPPVHESIPDSQVGDGGGGAIANEHGGGDLEIWNGGGFSDIDLLTWWYSNNAPQTINY